jgi:hypothetical protein
MMVVWGILVFAAFNLDDRSSTRLALAIEPYRDLAAMSSDEAESWAARMHQIKLFDANVLAGGVFGEGAGQGHAETAPNAADDGYITTIAAQWGLAGALALALLYTAFLIQMLSVAVREKSAFERSLVTGLAMLIAIPFWLATLGGVRVIPLTGVAAAFAAHGGAKLLASASRWEWWPRSASAARRRIDSRARRRPPKFSPIEGFGSDESVQRGGSVEMHGLRFDVAGMSEQGPRPENQDAYSLERFAASGVVAVADGMGGERSGRVAADTALAALDALDSIRSLDDARRAVRAADAEVARAADPTPVRTRGWGARSGCSRSRSRAASPTLDRRARG